MKFLVMCEGPNEKAIVDMLLDAECLEFTRDDLVNLTVYHARQLTAPIIKTALSIYTDEFQVYRIGDSMTDKLPVPADYKDRIKGVRKFCTKPELEMLLIIAEGKEAEFEKVKAGKHRMKPKDFCKANVVHNRKRYVMISFNWEGGDALWQLRVHIWKHEVPLPDLSARTSLSCEM